MGKAFAPAHLYTLNVEWLHSPLPQSCLFPRLALNNLPPPRFPQIPEAKQFRSFCQQNLSRQTPVTSLLPPDFWLLWTNWATTNGHSHWPFFSLPRQAFQDFLYPDSHGILEQGHCIPRCIHNSEGNLHKTCCKPVSSTYYQGSTR